MSRKLRLTIQLLAVLLLLAGMLTAAAPASATVSIPAGATITSATLSLYIISPSNQTVGIHRITSDWGEYTVTWSNQPGYADPSAYSFVPVVTGWYSINITSLVQAWVDGTYQNFGILLEQGNTSPYTLYGSSEWSDVTLRPKLEICYTVLEASTCTMIQRPGAEQNGVADTFIYQTSPFTNGGAETTLYTGQKSGYEKRSLLRFFFDVTSSARLGDFVWEDADADGVQDAAEAGIPGVPVNLYACDGALIASTTTDSSGRYLFTDLAAGGYKVGFVSPEGNFFSPQDQGLVDDMDSDADTTGMTGCINLAAGESNLTVDAGLYRMAKIGDFVWEDSNQNGIQEPSEASLEGVRVELYACDANFIQFTTTDASGYYSFIVKPGDYSVKFIAPTGYAFSPADQGMDDGLDSDADTVTGATACTNLVSGETDLTWDGGLYKLPVPKASIGDFVWYDMNEDGIQDVGEMGIEGIAISLYQCDGALAGTTATNDNGLYSFTDLAPGDYYLMVEKPAGYIFSSQDQGGDDAKDSDANPATGITACTTLTAGENDLTWDAGLYRPAYTNPGTGTPGYWKNHPEAWPVDVITIGGVTYTKAEAISWLEQNDKHDKTITMFRSLVAAKLNVLIGNDSSCIADTISQADAWMETYGPVGSGVRANTEAWIMGEPLYLVLDNYNNGLLCAPPRD